MRNFYCFVRFGWQYEGASMAKRDYVKELVWFRVEW